MPDRAETLKRALFQDLPEAVILTDPNCIVIDVNDVFQTTFGYGKDEVRCRSFMDLFAVSIDEAGGGENPLPRHRRAAVLHHPYRRADGTILQARTAASQLFDPDDGTEIGFAFVVHDLSGALSNDINAEAAIDRLEKEHASLRRLYTKTPAMMHSIDATGSLRTVSDMWLARLRYRREDVIGRPSTDFLTAESAQRAREEILPEFWKTGVCNEVPYTFIAADGERVDVELSAILETSGSEAVTLAFLHDVSQRNRAMRRLEYRNEQLRDFSRISAHDLQAPLRHILLFLDFMRSDLEATNLGGVSDYIEQCSIVAHQMMDLVSELLDYSTSVDETVKISPADLNQAARRAIAEHASEINRSSAQIELSSLPTVACDRFMVERVFSNLIGNALKYRSPDRTPKIRIETREGRDVVEICVSDNGIGVAPEFRKRIFQPLKRLVPSGDNAKGFGLGLAISKKIVEAHEGEIWADDSPYGGISIVVQLPRRLPTQEACDVA